MNEIYEIKSKKGEKKKGKNNFIIFQNLYYVKIMLGNQLFILIVINVIISKGNYSCHYNIKL